MEPAGSKGTGFVLRFDATQAQPQFAKLFLASGGSLSAAAADGATDFSLSYSTSSVKVNLHRTKPNLVQIDLPPELADARDGKLYMSSRSKLNISSQRIGAAINGTLVDTRAGAGSVYLSTLLRQGAGHFQIPLIYGTMASHACTVGCSNILIMDASGAPVDVYFITDLEEQAALDAAEKAVDEWAQSSWDVRMNGLQYDLSPSLTKTVGKATVGVNDKGYDLVHNIIDQNFPFSKQSLNSLLQHAIGMELEYSAADIDKFLSATAKPGLKAAVWMQTIAAATSTIANYLVSYRSDGLTVMGEMGSENAVTESWLRSPMRTPMEANDCDGSGLLVTTVLQTALDATEDERTEYPYIRATRNALHPYYTFGIGVVGATSSEASAGGGEATHVAGHALALVVPTAGFLDALHKASAQHTIRGKKLTSNVDLVRLARHEAMFSWDVRAELGDEERELLAKGPEALRGDSRVARAIASLQPYAIEGTTPASPVVYVTDRGKRHQAHHDAERDDKAFALAAPNVGRSFKVLHVGASSETNPHRFYHDFVELSLHASHSLYTDSKIREMGDAASQFVFVKPTSGTDLTKAGTSPRELATGEFLLAPLHTVDSVTGQLLDFAATSAKADVIPPRPGMLVLTDEQSRDLKRSMEALRNLDDTLAKSEVPGHCVAYTLAYSTLVNNPLSVEHFCEKIGCCSVAGVVDFAIIEDLAVHPGEDAEPAGNFVIVNSVVNV